MYLDYWQLHAKPFEPRCEASFGYAGQAQQAALHKLRYAIESRRAAALLAGPGGVGKTHLIDALRDELGDSFQPFASLVFPQMSDRDLLAYLSERLGAPQTDPPRYTIEESLRRLETTLGENARADRHAVVVIDEAHLLEDSGLIEPLRLLLNLRVDGSSAFTLLLVGQSPLLSMVARHSGLDERIDMKVLLPPLSSAESAAYIQHRLDAAGATREIFDARAVQAIHDLAGGTPRRINRLCDLTLLVAYAEQAEIIDADAVQAVHSELVSITPALAA